MSEEFKKMILSKWKGKITYPFNYKDFEELTELIELFENKNKDLQQRIDKAIEYVQNGRDGKGQSYVDFVRYVSIDDDKKLLSILQGKEME